MLAGPFRAASKPGAFMTMVAFFDIYATRGLLKGEYYSQAILVTAMSGGYTFEVFCTLRRETNDDVNVDFNLRLSHGKWDDYIEWPFSRKITLIITHLRDRKKDIIMPLAGHGHEYFKKPSPLFINKMMQSENISWREIEYNGFIVNKTLYVNIEFD
ncbi:hypothetical protein MTO96_027742 [Rhipicephalus appendiculatus]